MSNFLLLGYGSIGHRHTRTLRAMGHKVVTVDPDPEADAHFQNADGMNMALFDGVLDCTPPDVREGWRMPAKARFIEKPLGSAQHWHYDLDSQIMMGFSYRWNHRLEYLINEVRQYSIYRAEIIGGQRLQDWHREDYKEVKRRYHGVVTDSLPHSLYIARWLIGDYTLAGAVKGKVSDLQIGVEDVAGVLLKGPQGQPVYCAADYLLDPRAFKVNIVTDKGQYYWDFAPSEADAMYWRQMEVFCRVCSGDQAGGYPNLEDGVAVQEVLDAIGA